MNQLYVYIYPLPLRFPSHPPSHPSRYPQNIELSFLCYPAPSHELSILYMVVYICQCHSPDSSHPLFSAQCPKTRSPRVCLFFKDSDSFRSGPPSYGLEGEMATHSSILAWEIPRVEEPSRLQPVRSQIVLSAEQLSTHSFMARLALITSLKPLSLNTRG